MFVLITDVSLKKSNLFILDHRDRIFCLVIAETTHRKYTTNNIMIAFLYGLQLN